MSALVHSGSPLMGLNTGWNCATETSQRFELWKEAAGKEGKWAFLLDVIFFPSICRLLTSLSDGCSFTLSGKKGRCVMYVTTCWTFFMCVRGQEVNKGDPHREPGPRGPWGACHRGNGWCFHCRVRRPQSSLSHSAGKWESDLTKPREGWVENHWSPEAPTGSQKR